MDGAAARRAHEAGRASLHDELVAERPFEGAWATPHVCQLPVRTPTLPPATHTNVVLVVGAGRAVLIEPATPYEDELSRLFDAVEELERRGTPVREVWATHHHPDHIGGAAAICGRLGLPLRAHPATLDRVPADVPQGAPLHEGDREDVGGVAIEVLHVPGHAPGHLAFLDPKARALIAGDMVAAIGTILIAPGEGDMADYLGSLERLARLDPEVVVPAHGGAIRPGAEVFERYVAHRLLRERRVLDALGSRPRDLDALLPVAYADTPAAVWPIARLSLEAHLLKLERDGRAVRLDSGWALG
jgi:glyoxylase-like metal-dependent hydrolase (beta-lactamase superfamily II)